MSTSRVAEDEPGAIAAAAEVLRGGGCVVLPTDTVYGLAAALDHPAAVDRLAVLKGRPPGMPSAVLVASTAQAASIAAFPSQAVDLAARWWPGPLTIVLDAVGDGAAVVGAADGSIGVRCPDRPFLRALAELVGPLVTTSANLHGAPTPATADAVAVDVPGIDLLVDGGPCTGVPSTVIDGRGDVPVVLRPGPIEP
jgi:L-threonylcarbamoyladenylate synthase